MQKLTLAYYKYPSQTVRNPTSQSSSFFNTHSYTQKTTSSQFSKLKCQTQQQQQNPLFFLFFLFTHCTSSSYVPGSPPPQPKQPPTTWWISNGLWRVGNFKSLNLYLFPCYWFYNGIWRLYFWFYFAFWAEI